MKKLRWIGYLFAAIGFGLLAGGFFWYQSVAEFIEEATVARGEVIDLVRSSSSSSSGSSSYTYRPVVTFKDQNGQLVEFVSSSGSNPPSYSRGEQVDVFYRPEDPQNAKIDGFFSLWGGPMVLGLVGGVFALFGVGFTVPAIVKKRRNTRLRKQGTPVQTKLQGVEKNTSVRIKGRSPYRVVTQWQDPRTREIHVFTSEDLWFNPTDFLTGKEILVFIEPDKPQRHYMDLSFLPKMAES